MSSVYRPLLRRAWSITWQGKRLWLFGIFATLVMSGGELNVLIHNLERVQSLGVLADSVRAGTFASLPVSLSMIAHFDAGFYAVSALLFALTLFLLWFAIVAEGGLIWGIERARRRADLTIAEGIVQGKKMWGKTALITFGFHVSAHLAWMLFALPPFLLFLNFGSSAWFNIFLIIAFLCLIPIGFIIALLFRLALTAAVVEQESAVMAVATAWRLFCTHWLVLLETVIMLIVGTTLGAIIALSAAAVALTLLLGPLMLLSFVVGAPGVLTVIIGLAIFLFLLCLLAVGALLSVFQQAVWVLVFVRLRESPPFAKLVRLIAERGRIFGKVGS